MVIKAIPQLLKRVSIRWLPAESYENTDTIALNVGGFFMDLRVNIADQSLEWSRAGKREAVPGKELSTFRWSRIIDSFGSSQTDEAAFQELSNGDDLETGLFNKEGTLVAYEEVWRDVTGNSVANGPSWIVQSKDRSKFYGKLGGVFLAMQQDEQGHFGVRREDFDASEKTWELSFEGGTSDGRDLRRAHDMVMLLESDAAKGNGEIVDYIILGYVA